MRWFAKLRRTAAPIPWAHPLGTRNPPVEVDWSTVEYELQESEVDDSGRDMYWFMVTGLDGEEYYGYAEGSEGEIDWSTALIEGASHEPNPEHERAKARERVLEEMQGDVPAKPRTRWRRKDLPDQE